MRAFLIVATLVAAGCTTSMGHLSSVATSSQALEGEVIAKDVMGQDCMHVVLLIVPLGKLNPSIGAAVDDALDGHDGAARLTDVRVEQSLIFTVLYNRTCLRVRGDVRK